MAEQNKDRLEIEKLLDTDPEGEDWEKAASAIEKRFAKLDPENQAEVADKLVASIDKPGVSDLVEDIAGKGPSLPALIKLTRALSEQGKADASLAQRLEQWLTVCEGDESECGADEYFLLPENARAAIADHLALWLRADLLSALKDAATDKAAKKFLAKAIHRAKSAGATITEAGGERFVMAERDEYVEDAFMSPPDHTGTMFIYFYKTVFGKNTLFVVLINDVEGVIRFEAYEVARPRFDKIIESSRKNPHAIIAKVDPAFARLKIKRAEETGIERGRPPINDFLSHRRAMGIPDQEDFPHPVWASLDREKLGDERGMVMSSGDLISIRMFEDWRLRPLGEGTVVAELAEIRNSPIEMSQALKNQRENELFETAAKNAIDETGTEKWRDRLLACAYLLVLLDEKHHANKTAATALALEDTDGPPPPFFVEILRRTIEAEIAPDDEEGPKGPDMDRGGIIQV